MWKTELVVLHDKDVDVGDVEDKHAIKVRSEVVVV